MNKQTSRQETFIDVQWWNQSVYGAQSKSPLQVLPPPCHPQQM